ncbi:MAG: hypothetical protein Q7T86_15415 [Hyphomicrobiaceae bacterium]|nr:hypothetical protein [Hyphomicrobiaceae bacterium]
MTVSDIVAKIPRVQFRVLALALFAVLILHILATLAAPRLAPSTAYSRLADLLPLNSMQLLPPIAPGAQPLPFMGPDSRYAMCRFDSTKGPVQISAVLPGAGWSLSLFTDKGDSLYTSVAQPGRRTEISLVLVTSDEKFAGLTPEAAGQSVTEDRSLSLPAKRGIAILRAPDQGLAYKALNEAELKRSLCGVRGKMTAAR